MIVRRVAALICLLPIASAWMLARTPSSAAVEARQAAAHGGAQPARSTRAAGADGVRAAGAGAESAVAVAVAAAPAGFYHPRASTLFSTLDAYLAWYAAPGGDGAGVGANKSAAGEAGVHVYDPEKLTVGVYFHNAAYQQENRAHVDALVRAVEQRGQNVVVLTMAGSPPLGKMFVREGRAAIDVLLFIGERLHLKDREAGLAEVRALGVPVLSALNHHGVDAAGFAALANGLHPTLTPIVVNTERDAMFEPIVISGLREPPAAGTEAAGAAAGAPTKTDAHSRMNAPFDAQIAWRVDRALAWARLHRAANSGKRVVFTYWSEGGGKANAGGDPDDFLDVPASLLRLLDAMQARGFDAGPAPLPSRDELARRMSRESSNVGNWAPAELARRVAAGHAALVPEEAYKRWFDELPAARRADIVEMWGPPPGDVMVHTAADGRRYLVIPRIALGNVLIAPHPDWGQLQNRRALMAAGALPPHHQYLAFFFWLRREWHADAWVSLFSNIVLQPGKGSGPAADDYVALLLGALPHIHPERLGGNGGVANKRKGMALTPGWFNLVAPSDAAERYGDLRERIARYDAQDAGELRDDVGAQIRRAIVASDLRHALRARLGAARAVESPPVAAPSATTPSAAPAPGTTPPGMTPPGMTPPGMTPPGRTITVVPRDAASLDPATAPIDALVDAVRAHLDDLDRASVPLGSKVLGEAPTGAALADMVTGMLGVELRAALASLAGDLASTARRPRAADATGVRSAMMPSASNASAAGSPAEAPAGQRSPTTREHARRLVRAVLLDGLSPSQAVTARFGEGRSSPSIEALLARAPEYAARLRAAPREVESVIEALEGRWLEPGPMQDPWRHPDAAPPGRVLYAYDQGAWPTPEAEALGVRQAEALIAAHRASHDGAWPTRMAFVLWSADAARTQGVTEAQILHLLGARVIRNPQGTVIDVALIPREALGRPRVDVLATMSGTYRDNYGDKVELITKAVRLAGESDEADNPVAAATRAARTQLTASGESASRVEALAGARVFAPAPGAYSPGIQFLAKAGDARGDEARMADLFTSRMSHAYGGGLAGEAARGTFERQLAGVEGAALTRSGAVNGLLDQPMSAGFLGGMNIAAKALTGNAIDLYVSRVSEPDDAGVQSAASAIRTELDARYLNPRWLEEMTRHGYDGARHMMLMTEQLDLWSSTAARTVGSGEWADVKSVYVDDRHQLGLDRFFDRYNPHAQQLVLANLLGAASRGQWQASVEERAQVATRLAQSAAAHGAVCEATVCRNPALTAQVEEALAAMPDGAALAASYRAAIDTARGTISAAGESSDASRPPVETTASASSAAPASTSMSAAATRGSAPGREPARGGNAVSGGGTAPGRGTAPSYGAAPGRASASSRAPARRATSSSAVAPSPRARAAAASVPPAAPARAAAREAPSVTSTITGRVLERVGASPRATTIAVSAPSGALWWSAAGGAALFACGWILGGRRQAR